MKISEIIIHTLQKKAFNNFDKFKIPKVNINLKNNKLINFVITWVVHTYK